MEKYQSISVASAWPNVPQLVAEGSHEVLLFNPSVEERATVHFLTTFDGTPPTLAPVEGIILRPTERLRLPLWHEERLWFAAPRIGASTTAVTVFKVSPR